MCGGSRDAQRKRKGVKGENPPCGVWGVPKLLLFFYFAASGGKIKGSAEGVPLLKLVWMEGSLANT